MEYPILEIVAGLGAAGAAATLAAAGLARLGFPLPAGPRVGCIDGLRGYLALSVLAHHFVVWMQVTRLGGGWSAPSLHLFNQLGAAAVGLFFMTTGFVFYPRVLAGLRACPWPAILAGRVFRIVPLIAVSVAIITAIVAVRTGNGFDGRYPKAAAQWIMALGEPPLLGDPDAGRLNAYVLWSLRYEWQFYLFVLPACALAMDLLRTNLLRGRLPSWVVPAGLLAGALAARRLHLNSAVPILLPLFAVGMLAYEVQRHARLARILRGPGMTALALAALGIGMVGFSTPYAHAMPLFALFFACVACGNDLGGLLRTRAALVLGECSYGLYLLHGIVLSLLFVEAAGPLGALSTGQLPLLLPPAAVVALLAAAAGYRLVERPAIRFGRRLAGGLTRRRPRPDELELGAVR